MHKHVLCKCPFLFHNVTNQVCDLTPTHHQRSFAHHIDACTTLLLHVTHRLHFPSTIALITQLSPITHCTDYTAEFSQTRFISLGLPLSQGRVLFFATADIAERFPVDYLNCLYSFDRLLPAFRIFSLAVCRLHRPLHCPCLCMSLAYVTLVTVN